VGTATIAISSPAKPLPTAPSTTRRLVVMVPGGGAAGDLLHDQTSGAIHVGGGGRTSDLLEQQGQAAGDVPGEVRGRTRDRLARSQAVAIV
jgi:hypothetical protein